MLTLVSDSSNLGDNLALTPLLAHTPCRLRLLDEEWVRFTAPVFDGLCEIEWVTDKAALGEPRYASVALPWSKRALLAYGFPDVPAIPVMRLTEAERDEGMKVAAHLMRSFGKQLCVIKAVPGRSAERVVPTEVIDRIVAANPDIQFVTFNVADPHPKREMASPRIKGVYEIINLPVRAEAAVYAAIGRYVGADTGCYHMMLAVGGKADVLCPTHHEGGPYDYNLTHYGPACWLDTAVRVVYHDFNYLLTEGITGVRL